MGEKKKFSKKSIITLIVSLCIGIAIIAAIIISDVVSGEFTNGTDYLNWFKSDYTLGNAALVAVVGIGVVLAILLILILLLMLFNKIFGAIEKAAEHSAAKGESVQETVEAADVTEIEDAETVAAITAAISCLLAGESGTPPPFKVRRIKQVDKMKGKRN